MIPVILSGGSGSRLWPVSRETHPKPFIKLADGQSLLQKTYLRATRLPGVQTVLTVTNRDYYFMTRDDYLGAMPPPTANPAAIPANHFLLEPMGRNTAPAVLLAAMHCVERIDPTAMLLILAADHVITDEMAFAQAIGIAEGLAADGRLVTFGIVPTSPETGYGYIERGASLAVGPQGEAFEVARFVEKPAADVAANYFAGGCHYWNSGMFCCTAKALLAAAQQYAPELLERVRTVWQATTEQPALATNAWELPSTPFAELPDISFDYALMEHAERVAVVPANLGWSDVGSWASLAELTAADHNGNRVLGDSELLDVENCYIHNEQSAADGKPSRLIAAIGIRDMVIVDTPDALLVADRKRAQDVRLVVGKLKQRGHESARLHRTVARPWGTYTVLEEGPRFKIKRIVVRPGATLSLQMHYHRSEHWVVVGGIAKVVNGDREFLVDVNESTFIPAGCRHRLSNPGVLDLVIFEIQTGAYVGEDDIVRLDDQYGRC